MLTTPRSTNPRIQVRSPYLLCGNSLSPIIMSCLETALKRRALSPDKQYQMSFSSCPLRCCSSAYTLEVHIELGPALSTHALADNRNRRAWLPEGWGQKRCDRILLVGFEGHKAQHGGGDLNCVCGCVCVCVCV